VLYWLTYPSKPILIDQYSRSRTYQRALTTKNMMPSPRCPHRFLLQFTAQMWLIMAALFLVAACGNADPEAASEPPAADADASTDTETNAVSTLDKQGFINAFSLEATGDETTTWNSGDLSLSGGCSPGAPMSIGFRQGTIASHDYKYLGFDTVMVIEAGETGTFEVEEIRWDDGTQGESPRVPNRFTGQGTLTLTTHQAAVGNQRMSGTLRGEGLTNGDGASVDLVVDFDINRSCGISS
jgi:hypothetical protein